MRLGCGVPADRDPVILGDLVLDLQVESRVAAAACVDESVQTVWSEHDRFDARDMAEIVGGDEIVDQFQAAFVYDRVFEQLHLSLVELAHACHRTRRSRPPDRPNKGVPEDFPVRFRRCMVISCRSSQEGLCSSASRSLRRCVTASVAPARERGRCC